MKMLSILTSKPDKQLSDLMPLRIPEEKQVWELYMQGIIREMYWDGERIRVIFVLEVNDLQAAETAISSFPMVQAGLFDIQFIPLGPWQPLEVLFASESE